ncbi:STT3 domain-containing protein, partial [Caminibacter sp.]
MKYLKLDDMKFSNKTAFILVIVAYFFALGVRFYYYEWASKIKEFLWHGTLMINNPDGYWYAMGAKEILTNSHVVGDLAPIHTLPSILTAWIVKLFPFLSLDQVILWMPAVFGSLIVVPLFLIGRSLKNDILGFVAALLGGIAWSYYNRTLVGYYDTDMLVITFLLFVVWGVIEFFENKKEWVIYFIPLLIVLYEWWYPSCRSVTFAVLFVAFLYAFFKKDIKNFVFLAFSFLAFSNFAWYINLVMVLAVLIAYRYKKELFLSKNIYIFYGAVFLIL